MVILSWSHVVVAIVSVMVRPVVSDATNVADPLPNGAGPRVSDDSDVSRRVVALVGPA